jgi:hypothetical protein
MGNFFLLSSLYPDNSFFLTLAINIQVTLALFLNGQKTTLVLLYYYYRGLSSRQPISR